MRRIALLAMGLVVSALCTFAANVSDVVGSWDMQPFKVDLGQGQSLTVAAVYAFDQDGSAQARFFVLGDIDSPQNSMFYELTMQGDGQYSLQDGNINVNLEKVVTADKWTENTSVKNVKAVTLTHVEEGDAYVNALFSALTDTLSDMLKTMGIENVNVDGKTMTGIFGGVPVMLQRTNCTLYK